MKFFFKSCALGLALVFFTFVSSVLILFIPFPTKRRLLLIYWMHRCSRLILRILDVHYWLEFRGSIEIRPGTLFLANHTSYIDVLLLSACYPSVFVTSQEVRNTPLLGWLAKASGCHFVERRNRSSLTTDIAAIREILQSGMNVVIFPEGTTSDGSGVLPFKKSLLAAAASSSVEIRPLCINYRLCEGEPVSKKEANLLFYFGEMHLGTQLKRLLSISEVLVEMVVLPALNPLDKSCRKSMAEAARAAICQVFAPV
jgi:1-acyl-sn-glycerol-3-phosphate acyltransferase